MGITTKTSRNLTANAAIAIKNVGHAHPAPRLPYLVTYLGHKSLHSTLTYLTVTQELLQLASERYRSSEAGKILRGQGGAS
jgi:hypothetical protein